MGEPSLKVRTINELAELIGGLGLIGKIPWENPRQLGKFLASKEFVHCISSCSLNFNLVHEDGTEILTCWGDVSAIPESSSSQFWGHNKLTSVRLIIAGEVWSVGYYGVSREMTPVDKSEWKRVAEELLAQLHLDDLVAGVEAWKAERRQERKLRRKY